MARLTILAKGNADIRDSLYALFENGRPVWNGLNAVLRDEDPAWRAGIVHETLARSDALLAAGGAIPPALCERPLPLAAYQPAAQFTTKLFDGGQDAIILSIQADVMNGLARHRGDGHLLYPHDAGNWPKEDRQWLSAHYEPVDRLTAAQSMSNLEAIVARVRAAGDAKILIYNMSPFVPWERIHNYHGMGETLGARIRSFNLALIDLSRRTGISIVDVESVVAREGAERLKLDLVALTVDGQRAVAREVARILRDLGVLGERRQG
jgi:hypothetical protein